MKHDIAQNLAGVLVVSTQLRAPVVVVPGIDAVNILAFCLFAQLLGQSLGNAVDTANGGYNPYLVANTHVAILADIALECAMVVLDIEFLADRLVGIFEGAGKVGLQIVLVDPLATFHVFDGVTNGIAILDDALACFHVAQQYLVACRHVLGKDHALVAGLNHITSFLFCQTHHNGVGRINF